MIRAVAILLLTAGVLWGAHIKLYLTDGGYHLVREYEVQTDRVRFYTVERSQWEEMPLELIDLERTRAEVAEREEDQRAENEFWESEAKAERERRREIARVPDEPGVYFVDGGEIRRLPKAELDIRGNKKKDVLKVISPVPIFSGEKTVLIPGKHAEMVIETPAPEFYFRLYHQERFAIVRLTTKKEARQVEKWHIAPVTNLVFEEHQDIDVFRREVGDNLYMIWPMEPLEQGEYAVVEFSQGEANIQAWDFGYWASGAPPKE